MTVSKFVKENKSLTFIVILMIVLQFAAIAIFSYEFKKDGDLKSRQIQRLDAGINFDSRRQQFVIKSRDIIARSNKKLSVQEAYDIAEHDFYISEKYLIDPVLLLAMQRQESNFNTKAISSEGAIGLNQLLRTTAHIMSDIRGIAFSDTVLFDFKINNELAATYVSYLKADHVDISKILIGYNAGPNLIGIKNEELPEETRNYIPSVKKYYDEYNKELSFYLPGSTSD